MDLKFLTALAYFNALAYCNRYHYFVKLPSSIAPDVKVLSKIKANILDFF